MPLPVIVPSRTSAGGSKDRLGPVYVLAWTIVATSEANAYEILRDSGNVYMGALYRDHNGNEPDPFLACQSLNHRTLVAAPTGGTGLYFLEAVFAYIHLEGAPLWRTETQLVSVECEYDFAGYPIVNAVGEPFTPLSQRLVPETVLVREWLQFFTTREDAEAFLLPFVGKVNSTPYRGREAGCLLAQAPIIEEQWGYGTLLSQLFRCQMVFAYRPPITVVDQYGTNTWPGWHEVRPHKGFCHWENRDGVWTKVPNGDYPIDPSTGERGAFQRYAQPQWLTADGALTEEPAFIIFEKYATADFHAIGSDGRAPGAGIV